MRQIGSLSMLSVLNVADNAIAELPVGLSELKEKRIRELRLLPNPIADKKARECGKARIGKITNRGIYGQVLKILNSDRVEKVVKELFKYLGQTDGKRR
jgi:hypothetical protein